jgi:hypothetical protein
LRASLAARFEDVRVVEAAALWRVVIGHGMTLDAANQLAESVRSAVGDAVVVRDR